MAYSIAAITTLKRELERKKNLRTKAQAKVGEYGAEIETLEREIKDNDPAPALPLDKKDEEKKVEGIEHHDKAPHRKAA